MTSPKVLIDAQWRGDHFAAPVSPGFQATPLANRMVPSMPAVSFTVVLAPSMAVRAEGGHPLFLLRSIAQDPARGTQFIPNEATDTNPVEGSRQCVHGNTGTIMPLPPRSWPSPPLPGAINCGVVSSSDEQCLANLENLALLFADRVYQELLAGPLTFFNNYRDARAASHAAWAEALPGNIWDGIKSAAGSVWDGLKWVGGAISDAASAMWDDPLGTLDAAGQAVADSVTAAYNGIAGAIDVLSDPAKRQAILDAITDWIKESFAEIACDMAEALLEMLQSDRPLAAQLGEVQAAVEQQAAELAGQIGVSVLGDKGLSKIAMLARAGKAGNFGGGLFDRISDAIEGKPRPRRTGDTPDSNDRPTPVARQDHDDNNPNNPRRHDDDDPNASGGAQGQTALASCLLGCNQAGRPVNTAYGCKVLSGPTELDFALPAPLPLPWQRTYVSKNAAVGWLGQGWSTPFALRLQRTRDGLALHDEQGRQFALPNLAPGQQHEVRSEAFTVARSASGAVYTLVFQQGRLRMQLRALGLPPGAPLAAQARAPLYTIHAIEDANGNRIHLHYDAWPAGLGPDTLDLEDAAACIVPTGLTDSAGRRLRLEFAAQGSSAEPRLPGQTRGLRLIRVMQLSDVAPPAAAQYAALATDLPHSRLGLPAAAPAPLRQGERLLVQYRYDASGNLSEVQNQLGQTTRSFGWRNHLMVWHRDAAGLQSSYEYDRYAPEGKVVHNWSNDGQRWRFSYGAGVTRVTHTGAGDTLASTQHWFHDRQRNYTGHRDALGGELRRELDALGRLQAVTDEAGRTTRYQLDGLGRPTEVIEADGTRSALSYDARTGQVASITTADGTTTRYEYDQHGNLCAVTNALGHRTEYHHDARGLPVRIIDALGKSRELQFDAAAQLVRYTDCSGYSTTYEYDDWGHLVRITDALGQITTYLNDPLGRPVEIRYADGGVEQMQYDEAGRLAQHIGPQGAQTTYEYDIDGLPLARHNGVGDTLRYEYDALRRLKTLINENQARHDFNYDALSRLIDDTGFDGRLTRYTYDPTARLLRKEELGTGERLPGTAIETRYTLDALGRTVHQQVSGLVSGPPGSTPQPQVRHTRYAYDARGRLSEASNDAGSRTAFTYDALGQLVQEERQGQGLHTVLRHAHDALGNRIETTLPDGRQVHWLHYGSGHLHQIHVDGHVVCDIERDALHREVLRTQGQLTSHFQHDAVGRLMQQTAWRDQAVAGLQPGHHTAAPHALPQGPAVIARAYQYDRASHLTALHDQRHGTTTYQHDAIGRLLGAQHPGQQERFAFDPAHNLLPAGSASGPSGGLVRNNRVEVFEDKRYRYDIHGNLIEKRIGRHTVIAFSWDVEHQLQEAVVTRNGTPQRFQYHYDALGRRIAKRDAFGQTHFLWDGNLLLAEQRAGRQTLYLYEPGSAAPLAQIVDGHATRAPKRDAPAPVANDATHDADDGLDWHPREVRAAMAQQAPGVRRTAAPEPLPTAPETAVSLPAATARTWEVRYYHNDHLGTPHELTAENGDLLWSASYQAWGNVLQQSWLPPEPQPLPTTPAQARSTPQDLSQNLRFQGQYYDNETGLHYNRFRYYDPDCGRFISQDPIGLFGGNNSYLYALDPNQTVDILGWTPLSPKCFGLSTIAENPDLLKAWNDTLKRMAASPRSNQYKTYLAAMENGTQLSQKQLSTMWGAVRGEFTNTVAGTPFEGTLGEVHHWNYPKNMNQSTLFDPRHLVPTGDRDIHELLHRSTTSNPCNIWKGPIAPQHMIDLNPLAHPLP